MRLLVTAAASATVALTGPAAAAAATLVVEPAWPCYREQQRVFLKAEGYSPNAWVEFKRDGKVVQRLQADASGAISGDLILPGLLTHRRRLTYVGTDTQDPSRTAQVSLLTTATDVNVTPTSGAPNRPLRIRARGFFGGRTLWAHVTRVERRGGHAARRRARTVRIGRIHGPCRTVDAQRRLFRRSTAPGRYRVQFDTFRRYRPRRAIEYDGLRVRILSPASAP